MEKPRVFALSAIIKRIKEHIDSRIRGKVFWVKASVSQLRFDPKGHCYLTLHEPADDTRMVQCPARIWQQRMSVLRNRLGSDLDAVLKAGNEIVVLVEMEFNEFYGLAAIVQDIDIDFNLSQLEKRKKQTLESLSAQGLLDTNKEHLLPLVVQRIALVGSPNTNGVNDLVKELTANKHGYVFETDFFDCLVQGPDAENQIVEQLNKLRLSANSERPGYDLIALIRGGGSALDLEVFNSYKIAHAIATHPLAVHTGIGHEFDFSVADRVAHMHHKTPTALGSFLVARALQFEVKLTLSLRSCLQLAKQKMENQKGRLNAASEGIKHHGTNLVQQRRAQLHLALNRINAHARQLLAQEQSSLLAAGQRIASAPVFSIGRKKQQLRANLQLLSLHTSGRISQSLDSYRQKMELALAVCQRRLNEKIQQMESRQTLLLAYHPASILSKGYAIVRYRKRLLSTQPLQTGEQLEIELSNRTLIVDYISDKITNGQQSSDEQQASDRQDGNDQKPNQSAT